MADVGGATEDRWREKLRAELKLIWGQTNDNAAAQFIQARTWRAVKEVNRAAEPPSNASMRKARIFVNRARARADEFGGYE